jgi:hypothetical protein
MPIATMHDAATLAQAFAQAHVMGAKNDAEGMLAVTLIREIGIVKAESTYHIMMGRLTKKAECILADFVRAGGKYRIVQRDANGAKVIASMGETKDAEFSFMWEDAILEPFIYEGSTKDQRNALKLPFEKRVLKDKYATPRSRMQMLWARLVSDMGRALCPAATDGMYPPEEVADFDDVQPAGRTGAPVTINAEEVAKRADAQVSQVDYTVCPVGGDGFKGMPWAQMDDATLDGALASDNAEITHTHKAAIRLVLEERKAGAQ